MNLTFYFVSGIFATGFMTQVSVISLNASPLVCLLRNVEVLPFSLLLSSTPQALHFASGLEHTGYTYFHTH